VKRRQVKVEQVEGAIPECLLAGACVEVWLPPGFQSEFGHGIEAFCAVQNAWDLWRQRHGIGPWEHSKMPPEWHRRSSYPWSFEHVRRNPELLARTLQSIGLPASWEPSLAPPEWREKAPRFEQKYLDAKAAGRIG
jgi:hypothetical protein